VKTETVTVSRGALKLFLDLWEKGLLVNYDKAERLAGMKRIIDNTSMPVLKERAKGTGEFAEFEVPVQE
jgi:hypothetical protein